MENKQLKKEISVREKNNNIVLNYLLKISKINQLLMVIMDFNNNVDIDIILEPEKFNKLENDFINVLNELYKVVDKLTRKENTNGK